MARGIGFSIIVIIASTLAACGGGGGGGGTLGGNPPTATATITQSNAMTIAAAVTDASSETGFVSDLGGLAGPGGASTGSVSVGGAPVEEVSVGPETEACAVDGTSTFSAEIADPQTLSAGDSISLSFMQCDEGDGVLLDGAVSFVVSLFNGDVFNETFTLDVSVDVNNLQLTEAGETVTIDGDMNLLLDNSDTSNNITITVDGNSLSVSAAGESATLSDYAITLSADPVAGTSSFMLSGFLSASDFTGTVEFDTTSPFVVDSAGLPTGGVFVITGADGATITVRILSAQQIELDLDLDGDGAVEDIIVTSWSELQA